jgi:hypothetical protein
VDTRQTQHQHEQVDEVQKATARPSSLAAGGRGIVVPVINLQIKFPVIGLKIHVPRNNFPVRLSRELLDKWLQQAVSCAKTVSKCLRIAEFPIAGKSRGDGCDLHCSASQAVRRPEILRSAI